MMGNIGAAFFRGHEKKCPNCGSFGREQEEFHECPTCDTRFNEYVILHYGQDPDLQNN